MKERLISIDIAKGICIILVVIGHYHPENSPAWYNALIDIIYSFHMPLFMFASGYVYIATYKAVAYKDFIIKKFMRLMVPYFSISVIIITLKLLSESRLYVEHATSPLSYLNMFYIPEAGYFLWFVWTLFLMFLIIPFFKSKSSRIGLFIASIIFASIPITITRIFCLSQFKVMLLYFMLGIMVFEFKNKLQFFKKVPLIVYLVCFALVYSFKGYALIWIDYFDLFRLIIAILGILTIYKLSMQISLYKHRIKELLILFSASSYIIYLFHTTFEGFVKSVILKVPFLVDQNNVIIFTIGAILVIFAGVVFPILLHRYILLKNKTLCLLFGLNYKK